MQFSFSRFLSGHKPAWLNKVNIEQILIGVLYMALIGVVVYGMHDHVYDGFGNVVPWIIIVIFGIMSIIRIAEGITKKEFLELAPEVWEKIKELKGFKDGE